MYVCRVSSLLTLCVCGSIALLHCLCTAETRERGLAMKTNAPVYLAACVWQASHFVPVRVGGHRVLGGQGDAAGRDHQQDGHLKVTQCDNVVTAPAHTGE